MSLRGANNGFNLFYISNTLGFFLLVCQFLSQVLIMTLNATLSDAAAYIEEV